MPGLPSATPQPTPQHDPNLLDALTQRIMEHLSRSTPQPPLAPSPAPLTPLAAMAAARNPQLTPLLTQRANAPGQAQYQQALMAFQDAMKGEGEAMQGGIALAGHQANAANTELLRQIQLLSLGERAQYHQGTLAQTADKPNRLQIRDTPKGPMWFDPSNPAAPGVPAKYPGGEDVGPKPNLQAVRATTSLNDLLQTYSDMKALFRAGHGYSLNPTTKKIEHLPGQPEDVLVHGAEGGGVLVHPTVQSRTQQILSGWATRPSWTRGALSGLMPSAATHEELRSKTIPQLLGPISGQNRAMASLMEQFQHFLPDWTTAPEAAEPAFANADAMLERARNDLGAFTGGAPSSQQSSAAPTNETREQKKARILTKYGVQ